MIRITDLNEGDLFMWTDDGVVYVYHGVTTTPKTNVVESAWASKVGMFLDGGQRFVLNKTLTARQNWNPYVDVERVELRIIAHPDMQDSAKLDTTLLMRPE